MVVTRARNAYIDFDGETLGEIQKQITDLIEIYGTSAVISIEISTHDYSDHQYIDSYLSEIKLETDEQYGRRIQQAKLDNIKSELARKTQYEALKKEFDK